MSAYLISVLLMEPTVPETPYAIPASAPPTVPPTKSFFRLRASITADELLRNQKQAGAVRAKHERNCNIFMRTCAMRATRTLELYSSCKPRKLHQDTRATKSVAPVILANMQCL